MSYVLHRFALCKANRLVPNGFSLFSYLLLIWLTIASKSALAAQCFSCHGECYSAARCNCQTGVCEGDYCFTEKWSREGGFVIYKGCGKGRHTIGTMGQCEYQRIVDRLFCLCNNENFCNEDGAKLKLAPINNATCYHCSSGATCTSKCHDGEYCSADFTRTQFICAHGKPLLPFHYQGYELRQTFIKPWPACASFRAGPVHHFSECSCTNALCNSVANLRGDMHFDESQSPLLYCHSCAEEMLSDSVLPNCRRQLCVGQFCAIKVESVYDALASGGGSSSSGGSASGIGSSSSSSWNKSFRYKQWSGCLNTTRPDQVLKGTFQRWTVGTRQVTECVCRKDYCNLDVKMCMKARATKIDFFQLCSFILCSCMLLVHNSIF